MHSPGKRKRNEDFVFDIMDALTGPVLTFSQSWADTIPKRLLDLVPLARLIALKQREEKATLVECVVYIYTRTLEAPMSSEWVDIYTHLGCKIEEDWFGNDYWETVKAPKQLDDWLLSKLQNLQRHLYTTRRVILKSRHKQSQHSYNIEPSEKKSKPTITSAPTLFT